MTDKIQPFIDSKTPMKPWPALGCYAKTLSMGKGRGRLFFYDTEKSDSPEKPSVILIHGLGDEADTWRHIIGPLSNAGFRVLALDLPGFGRSEVSGSVNLARHGDAVIEVLEAAGLSQAVLVGNSMGGAVAQTTAQRRPDLVKALILIDGGLPLKTSGSAATVIGALPIIGPRWYRALRQDPGGAYASLFGFYADFDGLPQADKDFLRERVMARVESPSQERAYFSSLRSMIGANITGIKTFAKNLADFPGRVLMIWGESDPIFPPASTEPLR
jgi:pimeloyl-ACP methyl ester carboxylesterase